MILFFDTETTGLPKNYKALASDLENWPRLVQLAWQVYGEEELVSERSLIVKPEGFEIPGAASAIHHVTQERALTEGIPLLDALQEFREALEPCELLVAHNLDFDVKIVGAEFLRVGLEFPQIEGYCTKLQGTDLCKLPGKFGYKWPTLQELHIFLFGKGFEAAHDALVDVKACASCFWEMQRREG